MKDLKNKIKEEYPKISPISEETKKQCSDAFKDFVNKIKIRHLS